jgi:radical SAM superfamily enzyme YgiQ (UPF0313 family)/wyosine [tRNA(Phe)-imidazoG37] synthetase (radical SAM superfamily)
MAMPDLIRKFKRNMQNNAEIERDDVRITVFPGKIKVYWKGLELTADNGILTPIFVLGNCADSTQSEWSVQKINAAQLVIKNRWRELPLTQVWGISISEGKKIDLEVKMELEEDLTIDDKKAFFIVSEKYDTCKIPFKEGRLAGSKEPLPDILFIFNGEETIFSPTWVTGNRVVGSGKVLAAEIQGPSATREYLPGLYDYFSMSIVLFDKDLEDRKRLDDLCDTMLGKTKIISSQKPALSNALMESQGKDMGGFKVVLVNLPWQRDGACGVRAGSRWPHIRDKAEGAYLPFPFYLAYAASLLKKNGFKVTLIDAIAQEMSEAAFLNMLPGLAADLLLVETSTVSLREDMALLRKIDTKGTRIALCGPDVNIRDPLFLKENGFIEYVLVGEYEFTLLDLARHLRDGKNVQDVSGLLYRDAQGKVNKVVPRPSLNNLDELPWPLREQLPVKKYLDAPCEIPFPTAQMWASRGCPFRCVFCLWPQIMYGGNHYRVRSVVDVVDEMEYLVKEMGFKSVYFDDDTFNIGKPRMLEFCRQIRARKLKVPWAIMARADLMDEEILTRMKEAGVYAVKYGVESGVQELLDNSNKNMNLEKAKRMILFTKRLGIRTHLTFTFGLPGETKETIQRTIECAFALDPYSAQFSITTYYPGTDYFEYLDKKGLIITKDWSDYDGNSKSVIRSDNLTGEYLENAKNAAVEKWLEHQRLKRCLQDNYQVFKRFVAKEGLGFTIKKSLGYCKRRYVQKGLTRAAQRLATLKNFTRKAVDYVLTGRAQRDYLDMVGVYDGSYAYKGPNFVQIDLTNDCNNDCIGCWCNSPLLLDKKQDPATKKKTIPYWKAKGLLDELHKLGTKEIYLAGGGEPFMHPEIMDVLAHIKQKKLICDINTNFTLMDEEKIKKIISLKIDSLVASVWAGSAATYVATHPNKDEADFYKIKERLTLLNSTKDKVPHTHIYNVITNLNFHEIELMVEFALEVKADSVGFTVLDTIPGRTDVLLLHDAQRKEIIRQCERIRARQDMGTLQILEFDKFIRRISSSDAKTAEYDREVIDSMPCYIGWLFTRIMADGNVNACLKAHRIPVGNIYKDNFLNIWNGALQREFRRKTLVCKKEGPFFSMIGNDPAAAQGCYKSCDDMNRNMYMHKRMHALSAPEAASLRCIAAVKKLSRKAGGRLVRGFPFSRREFLAGTGTKEKFDIALVVAPPWAVKMPPLGVAYVVTYLKRKGFKPFVYDLNLKLHNTAVKSNKVFWDIKNLNNKSPENVAADIFCIFKKKFSVFIDELLALDTGVIGFSTNLISLWVAFELAKLIKARDPGKIIIFGGPGCFWDYKRIEPGVVDAFVIGEGEESLCDILRLIKEGKEISDIPGVVTLSNGTYSRLISRKPLDIQAIPFPDFTEFTLKEYNQNNNYKPLPLLTSRGCIGKCTYCIDHRMWGQIRCKAAESIFHEIEYHITHYGKTGFEFNDLICNGNLKELEKFSELLINSGHKINWVSYAIIRKDMTLELFEKMKKSGCHTLIYGMESGSDTVLKRMNKYYTAREAEGVLRLCHQSGICTNINLIVGFPGESKSEFNETVEFLKRNKAYIDEVTNVSGCVLFPESEMGHNRDTFGIRLPPGRDPLLYEDSTGIGPEVRKERVEKLLAAISDMGIKKQIINNPTETRIEVSKNQ